jgi:RNA polymerase sigma-70 factor, ECF subfamily
LESDIEIVAKVLAGDTEAYAELVRRYERSARATALAILRDAHAAADVAQEAFVLAYTRLAHLRTEHYGPWLLQIVRRQSVRAARRRRPIISLETVPQDSIPETAAAADTTLLDDHERLLAAINRLPVNERLTIMLRYFDDYDTRAIAAATGCAESAVFKRLSRARQRLRHWLSEEEG